MVTTSRRSQFVCDSLRSFPFRERQRERGGGNVCAWPDVCCDGVAGWTQVSAGAEDRIRFIRRHLHRCVPPLSRFRPSLRLLFVCSCSQANTSISIVVFSEICSAGQRLCVRRLGCELGKRGDGLGIDGCIVTKSAPPAPPPAHPHPHPRL
jgi:hypothetical protein